MKVIPMAVKLTANKKEAFQASGIQDEGQMKEALTFLGVQLMKTDSTVRRIANEVQRVLAEELSPEKIDRLVNRAEALAEEINQQREEQGLRRLPCAPFRSVCEDLPDALVDQLVTSLTGRGHMTAAMDFGDEDVPVANGDGEDF